jgi:hypothetical protein
MEIDNVRLNDLGLAQQLALMRLHLFLTREVHRLIGEAAEDAQQLLRSLKGSEVLGEAAGSQVQVAALRSWDVFIQKYTELIKRGIKQACAIPFGTVAQLHERLVLPAMEEITAELEEAAPAASPFAMGAYYDEAVQEALTRRYRDGLAVSERIWVMNNQGSQRIGATILSGVKEGKTVNQVALGLQTQLAAVPGCRGRINKILRGVASRALLTLGGPCTSVGLSYNAGRLARNEMTVAMNIANDIMISRLPYVEGEAIRLNSTHTVPDECDAVAAGGNKGDGVYPVGTIALPLHVLCVCYKDVVLMNPDKFGRRLGRFVRGERGWSKAEKYQNGIGGNLGSSLAKVAIVGALAIWLSSGPERLEERFWEEDAEMIPEELLV